MEALSIEQFLSGASRNRLVGLRCEKGHVTTPPRHSCATCHSTDLAVTELSGKGEVTSYTEVFVKSQDFPVETPFMLALVTLTEGPKLLGVIQDHNVTTGAKVKVVFKQIDPGDELRPRIFFDLEQN